MGGNGDDVLLGGGDNDVMRSGHGDDLIIIHVRKDINNAGPKEIVNGGAGSDTLVLQVDYQDRDMVEVLKEAALLFLNGETHHIAALPHLDVNNIELIRIETLLGEAKVATEMVTSTLFHATEVVALVENAENLTRETVMAKLEPVNEGVVLSFALEQQNGSESYVTVTSDGRVYLTQAGIDAINHDSANPLTSIEYAVVATNIHGNQSRLDFEYPVLRTDDAPQMNVSVVTMMEESVSVGDVVAIISTADESGDAHEISMMANPYVYLDGNVAKLTALGVSAINDDSTPLSTLAFSVSANDGENQTQLNVNVPIVRVNETPVIYFDNNDNLFEVFVKAGDVLTEITLGLTTASVYDFSIKQNAYYDLYQVGHRHYEVRLTETGVDAINNDTLAIADIDIIAETSDGDFIRESSTTVNIHRVNETPKMQLPKEIKAIEGEMTLFTLQAEDAETLSQALTYQVVGGRDGSLFQVVNQTLLFKQAAMSGQYEVMLNVSDGEKISESVSLTVEVLAGTYQTFGTLSGEGLGLAVTGGGDYNHDGYVDFVVSRLLPNKTGMVQVVYGSEENTHHQEQTIDSDTIDEDYIGAFLSDLGDINADGVSDFIIGSFAGDTAAAVIYGREGGISDNISFNNVPAGEGLTIMRPDSSQVLPSVNVAKAGDINGDGFADMIVSLNKENHYVLYGQSQKDSHVIDLSKLNESHIGYKVTGFINDINFQGVSSATSAGDINGDGYDDMLFKGQDGTYLVYGKSHKILGGVKDISDIETLKSFKFDINAFEVSGAGDVNGDGYDDFMFSDAMDATRAEKVFVIFGQDNAFHPDFNIDDLDGSNGFSINAGDGLGNTGIKYALSQTGDVNGDGLSDIMISDINDDDTYVIYGDSQGYGGHFNIADIQNHGVQLTYKPEVGYSLSDAGDINGDGFADIVLGGAINMLASQAGSITVYHGRDSHHAVTHRGSGEHDELYGSDDDDVLYALQGNDVLFGGNGRDRYNGGSGDDVFHIDVDDIDNAVGHILQGGLGYDEVVLASNQNLNLYHLKNNAITDVEGIDLSAAGQNTLTLDVASLLKLSSEGNALVDNPNGFDVNELLVKGNAEDVVRLVNDIDWQDVEPSDFHTINGEDYHFYYVNHEDSETSLVAIDTDIQVQLIDDHLL